jgi:exopolysaccharide production protein ExoQ
MMRALNLALCGVTPTSATFTAVPSAATTSYAETGDPFLFKRGRTWWLLLALFLMAQGGGIFREQTKHLTLKVLRQVSEPSDSGSLLVATIVMWVICAGLMVKHIGPTLRLMLRQKAMLAFAVLAFLSTLWSQVPLLTFRRATVLFLTMVFAWFFAKYYSPTDQMRLLLALGVIMALASIAWAILLPNYGIQPTGEWKGVFGQKNFLGSTMFFLFAGLPFCRISSGRRLLTVALQAVVPISLILLSQSRSSLILVVVLLAVRVFGPLMTRTRREAIPFMLYFVAFGMVMIATSVVVILPLLGRDLTLTGRTHNWAIIFPFVLKHIWLGYGYQGFWVGASGDSGKVDSILGGGLNVADNGYLDLMLQFGLLGMGLLLVLLIVCIRDFGRLLRRSSVPLIAYWYVGLILAIFVGSVAEGMFFMPIRIIPFMFVLACAGLRTLSPEDRDVATSGKLNA